MNMRRIVHRTLVIIYKVSLVYVFAITLLVVNVDLIRLAAMFCVVGVGCELGFSICFVFISMDLLFVGVA